MDTTEEKVTDINCSTCCFDCIPLTGYLPSDPEPVSYCFILKQTFTNYKNKQWEKSTCPFYVERGSLRRALGKIVLSEFVEKFKDEVFELATAIHSLSIGETFKEKEEQIVNLKNKLNDLIETKSKVIKESRETVNYGLDILKNSNNDKTLEYLKNAEDYSRSDS